MQGAGLSVPTLVIASLSSLAAALFINTFWKGGAILGAAVTPVIVALVSEMLRKPVSRFETLREERRERSRRGRETFGPPSPAGEPPREDRFGIWGEETPPQLFGGRLNARHLKIALATGIAAFVLVTVGLTAAEMVFGGSAGGGDRRTTIFGGRDRDAERERRERDAEPPAATETQPEQIPETTPEEPGQPVEPGLATEPPAEEAPPETVPGETLPEAAPAAPTTP